MTQAVILAAGFGSRLRPLTDERPKALLPFGGRPLIARMLDALVEIGVKSAVVVTGHARAPLEAYLATRGDLRIVTVENADYAGTNTLASLLCAAPWLHDDFVLLDGDLVFEPSILGPLSGPGTRVAVDRGRPLDDDAVKAVVEDGRITALGKTVPRDCTPEAESIGIARIDGDLAVRLFAVGQVLLSQGARQAYYEAAFQRLIEQGFIFEPADVSGLRWVEIDDHEDLERARALFLAPDAARDRAAA